VTKRRAPTPEAEILRSGLDAATRLAGRLRRSQRTLEHLAPFSPERLDALSETDEERVDAMLQRFGTLAILVQDHLFKAVLVLEEEDVGALSQKDRRLRMEALGALPASVDFGRIAVLRNRLAHDYPNDPARRASIVSAVFGAIDDIVAALDGIVGYARAKHIPP